MEVPLYAPGMKESVDKCTKKIEIQSQKWQYEIAHMYNYVLKTDKSKTHTFTFGGTSKRTKSFGEESMFPNQYDSQKKIYVLCVK
jgi:hypothetical protein